MNKYRKKLTVIGDSGVYGWGDIEGGGWCERLRRSWLVQEDKPIVYSLGVRGDGLEKVASRWEKEWECRGELRRKVPEALLLSIGLNDTARIGTPQGRPQLSSEAFHYGLEAMLKQMKELAHVMMIGLTPVNEAAMPFAECLWYSNSACFSYEKRIEEVCLNLNVPFLSLHTEMLETIGSNKWIEPDGIHLNSPGHKWIYKKIIEWQPLLKWCEI